MYGSAFREDMGFEWQRFRWWCLTLARRPVAAHAPGIGSDAEGLLACFVYSRALFSGKDGFLQSGLKPKRHFRVYCSGSLARHASEVLCLAFHACGTSL
jgi:hypothetical protein